MLFIQPRFYRFFFMELQNPGPYIQNPTVWARNPPLFLKTHGTAVSCYTGEEERKQQSKEINCLINV